MLPPPDPISIRSSTGMRIGSPLPDLNLWTRATSIPLLWLGLAALDYAGLGGRAAHVQRNKVRLSEHIAVEARRERARRRAGLQKSYRTLARGVRAHDAARRVHHQKLAAVAQFGQVALDAADVP